MRETLSDLESGVTPPQSNPVKRTQEQMRQPRARRLYKLAGVQETEDGRFVVELDGKPALTPGRNRLMLRTRSAAEQVAAEFAAQGETLDPMTMLVTRLVNTAIDGVASDPQAVLEDILRFASSDLLCYRAGSPRELVERQAAAWDPVLDWVRDQFGVHFVLSEGVMHVEQPRESIAVLGVHLRQRAEPFRLACLHVMTTLMGSALLALAVEGGALSPDEAWSAAHLDEDWWGRSTRPRRWPSSSTRAPASSRRPRCTAICAPAWACVTRSCSTTIPSSRASTSPNGRSGWIACPTCRSMRVAAWRSSAAGNAARRAA
jgi:chaperone required for assembly of F1-ATPase